MNAEKSVAFDLKAELCNVVTLIGFIIQVILNDNNLLEFVSINNIYKTVYEIFKNRFFCILNEEDVFDPSKHLEKGGSFDKANEKDTERKRKRGRETETKTKTETNTKTNKERDWETDKEENEKKKSAQILAKEIKLKFEQIYHGEEKKKNYLFIKKLQCLKYAIGGCIYFYTKVSNKKVSLRNILNVVDYNLFLLNTDNIVIADPFKNMKDEITSTINIYDTINKEYIYIEKDESFKMEKIALFTSGFGFCSNIQKYSLLYELLFIMKTPYLINKFIFSVFNDVVCIPFIHQNFSDVVIVITCVLFVNHFFYFLYKKKKSGTRFVSTIKKIYIEQVKKILNIFFYLHQINQTVEIKNVLLLFSRIIRLYSIKY